MIVCTYTQQWSWSHSLQASYLFPQREMRSSVVLLLSVLLLLCVVVEVHSLTYPFVRYGNIVPALSNHSYLDLTTVGTVPSDRVKCHTDLSTCCSSRQGSDRGDWFFPNGSVLQFSDSGHDIYQFPAATVGQRIDLSRRNNGVTNGIYQCAIETNAVHSNDSNDTTTREIIYVGLYASGGEK